MIPNSKTVVEAVPEKSFYLTLDLEYDHVGINQQKTVDAVRRIDDLLTVLERREIPLTCFLQTELLYTVPAVVERLRESSTPVEVHPHSHTHPRREAADVDYEVRRSVAEVGDEFGTNPTGFRFPEGDVREGDLNYLKRYGVEFDASLFPSWRPGQFDFRDEPVNPFRYDSLDLIELPFTVYSERWRVPVSLSYMKLLRRPYREAVYRSPPTSIVFDMHMHDLFPTSAREELGPFYRTIYALSGGDGLGILTDLLSSVETKGYSFELLSSLYRDVQSELERPRDDEIRTER